MPQKNVHSFNTLPNGSDTGVRISILEKRLDIVENKLKAIQQVLNGINNAVAVAFKHHGHQHQILIRTLLEKNMVNIEELTKTHEIILADIEAEKVNEANQQKGNQAADGTDRGPDSTGTIGAGEVESPELPDGIRVDLSEAPGSRRTT